MSDCMQCARAIIGVSSKLRQRCDECEARGIARSSLMQDVKAGAHGAEQALWDAIAANEVLRHLPPKKARQMVDTWWDCDRANERDGKAYA
jgi:uncharacterized NAD(P)/FAD-binding protein YdhS